MAALSKVDANSPLLSWQGLPKAVHHMFTEILCCLASGFGIINIARKTRGAGADNQVDEVVNYERSTQLVNPS